VVVLGGDEDESVELVDGLGPGAGVLVLVAAGGCGDRLVEQRQVRLGDVHHRVLGFSESVGVLLDPAGDLVADASGSRAADDDADAERGAHSVVLLRFVDVSP